MTHLLAKATWRFNVKSQMKTRVRPGRRTIHATRLCLTHVRGTKSYTIICNAVCGKFAGHTVVETFKAVPFRTALPHKRHSSVVNTQSRLRAERLTSRGSLPGMGKRFLSTPNLLFTPALVTTQLPIKWVAGPFPQRSAAWTEADSSPHLVRKLIMIGAMRQIPTMHLQRAQRQIHFILISMQVWMFTEEFGCATTEIVVPYHSIAMLGWTIILSKLYIVYELYITVRFEVPRLWSRRKLHSDTWRCIVWYKFTIIQAVTVGRNSAVGIATRYELDGLMIESQWRRNFTHPSRIPTESTQPPIQWVPSL